MNGLGHRLIRASAGSGKTYQLTRQYLALLLHGVRPESILATTFTRKAAGEILARVLGRLADAAASPAEARALGADLNLPAFGQSEARTLLGRFARSLHRVSISTIDSFFNRIAQSFRHELGLPPQPQLVDAGGPIARELRLEAIESILGDAAESEAGFQTLIDMLRRLHHDATVRSVTQAIDDVVSNLYETYRAAPDRALWTRLEPKGLLGEEALLAAIDQLRALEDQIPLTASRTPRKLWVKAWSAGLEAATARRWDDFLRTGLASHMGHPAFVYGGAVIPRDWISAYQPLIDHALGHITQRIALQTEATYDLLHQFDRRFTALRQQRRIMLFSDLSHKLAHDMPLRDDLMAEVYYRLDGRVEHLLLDEFQDTSLDQWQVLEPIAREIVAYSDGSRSFFCVGDVKQAIYGWRGGCAELFDHIASTFRHTRFDQTTLARSYRSSSVVLDAVNRVFENIEHNEVFEHESEPAHAWQACFVTHEAQRDLPGHVTLETTPAATSDDPDDDSDDAELPTTHEYHAAQRIAELHHAAPGCEIGVLVRRNQTVNRLMHELRRLGLPVSGEAGNPVTDSAAVAVVLSALQLADHPGDTAAAFHVASSPLGPIVSLTHTGDAARQKTALAIRRALLYDGYADTIARWVRQLAPSCDRRSVVRLTQLVELAQQYEPEATLRPSRFVEFVEATPVEEPTSAPIRVMTIHASKGLEFDAVVLPELDGQLQDRPALLLDQPDPVGPILGVYRGTSKDLRNTIQPLGTLADRSRSRSLFEDLCALYVAMTRARHALHMIVKPRGRTKSGLSNRGFTSLAYASILRQSLGCDGETEAGGQVLFESGDERWRDAFNTEPRVESATPTPVRATVATSKQAERSWMQVSPSALAAGGRVRVAELLNLTSSQPRLRGSVMHAWLAQIRWLDSPPAFDYADAAVRVDATCDRAWIDEQWRAFQVLLRKPGVAQVFQPPADDGSDVDVWLERPFAVCLDGRVVRGAFDRVVIRRCGGEVDRVELIDFKTDRVGNHADRLVEHYQPQVRLYRDALATMLAIPPGRVTAKLVFVETGDVRNVACE